jgi:hypothetical protein
MPRFGAIEKSPSTAQRGRHIDLALGIALGLVLGFGIVYAFVFLGGESSIDAPHISGVNTGKPAQRAATGQGTTTTGEPPLPRSSH